ncbi:MAG: ketopantoate reductase family protein [Anaerolineales bacterium]
MQITIFGTGAMACLFGAGLAPVANVTLLGAWAAGLQAIHERGIRVEPAAGPAMAISVGAASLDQPTPPADMVLVLVKTWQTPRVAAELPARLKPGGLALTLQNGLGNLEQLGPSARLGVTTLGATLLGPGRVRPGGQGPTHVAGPAWMAATLAAAGFEAHTAAEQAIDSLLWGKLAINCGINALTALLRVPNGELLRRPDAQLLMEQAAAECAAVAAARGILLPYADAPAEARAVAARTASNHSSMFQDILRSAPTEIEAINGAVARAGQELRVPVPLNTTLWHLVRASATGHPLPAGDHGPRNEV